jgi:hypothetical protein
MSGSSGSSECLLQAMMYRLQPKNMQQLQPIPYLLKVPPTIQACSYDQDDGSSAALTTTFCRPEGDWTSNTDGAKSCRGRDAQQYQQILRLISSNVCSGQSRVVPASPRQPRELCPTPPFTAVWERLSRPVGQQLNFDDHRTYTRAFLQP